MSALTLAALAAMSLALAFALTGLLRRYALARGMLDQPNARSSHSVPTPRGGGMAIVIVVTAAIAGLWFSGRLPGLVALGLLVGGLPVAAVGWIDDRRPLPAVARLLVHLLGCTVPVTLASLYAGLLPDPSWLLLPAALTTLLALVWLLNLYNFMDGIDGLAGTEAATAAAGAALLLSWQAPGSGLSILCLLLASAAAGFLYWNWPPARIFMGDGASGFLGFLFGGMALFSVVAGSLNVWVWLILLGVFIVDASLTLLARLYRGQRLMQAHRSHAYQRLARHLASHRAVSAGTGFVNLFWLLPLAALAQARPELAPALLLLAWLPLAMGWAWASRRLPAD